MRFSIRQGCYPESLVLKNIRHNRMISLRQLIDEIMADRPTEQVADTLFELRCCVEEIIQTSKVAR